MLEIGMKAPDFSLTQTNGDIVSLHDFIGKKVVVYFYPKDNTPGCTTQACAFASAYEAFKSNDIVVIGISKDSIKSHEKFADKYNLPFLLLSDPDIKVIEAYQVWKNKMMYGKSFMGVMRSTFVINEEGIIVKIFEKADPANNAKEILDFLFR